MSDLLYKLGLAMIALIWYGLGIAVGGGNIRLRTMREKLIYFIMLFALSIAMLTVYT